MYRSTWISYFTSRLTSRTSAAAMLILIALTCDLVGCETGAQTGALAGGGIGALAGQAIGGDTGATLIGGAVGIGIGYIIGNESDKRKAKEMSAGSSSSSPTHDEVGPLGDTRWKVVSINPSDVTPPYASKIVEFRRDGRAVTTTTKSDGKVETFDESYRVVGDTLIINKPGYLVNARYRISGKQLIVNAEDFSAVLDRL